MTAYRQCVLTWVSLLTDKSKVMHLGKMGSWEEREKWFIDGNILEVVSRHQYFDFTFTTTMNANQSAKQLADNGKESLFDLLRTHPVGTNV